MLTAAFGIWFAMTVLAGVVILGAVGMHIMDKVQTKRSNKAYFEWIRGAIFQELIDELYVVEIESE